MYLKKLELTQFKNYNKSVLEFHPAFNTITGLNGMGKTNILDAIYYISLGKGYFASLDKYAVRHEENFFRIKAEVEWESSQHVSIVVKYVRGGKKEMEINGTTLERLSEHVGKIPCVIFAPEDIKQILDTSEARRNFLNQTLVQIDHEYLHAIQLYNKLLKARNAYLKQQSSLRSFDGLYLESLAEQMNEPAQMIFTKRENLVSALNVYFSASYARISGEREQCSIAYESQLSENDMVNLLAAAEQTDKIMGRTTCGIHKDDLVLYMNGKPVKYFGSQGQLKSFILALKLAQYKVLEQNNSEKPLILLDDIFDKLDNERVNHLLRLLSESEMGQVFITDTDAERIPGILKAAGIVGKHLQIFEGKIQFVS